LRKKVVIAVVPVLLLALVAGAWAAVRHFPVRAGEYDPLRTHLVQGTWVSGIGCPTNARTAGYTDGVVPGDRYTDPACDTGDPRDRKVRGLLLAKTGPTPNVASAVARVKGVRGLVLTELGYDIRKPGTATDPRGSHCGAGAPRFNVRTADGALYFIGCNSPAATSATVGTGWIRLRWGGDSQPLPAYGPGGLMDISGMTVKSIRIVFDEGQDTGPDSFGLAVLDNIDVNGHLTGRGNMSAG
jgi:hypothetical protein